MLIIQLIALLIIVFNIVIFTRWNIKNNKRKMPLPKRGMLLRFFAGLITLIAIIILWSPASLDSKPEPYTGEGRYLAQNIPTSIDDYEVIASNISDNHAVISVVDETNGKMAESITSYLGDEVTLNGLMFTIVHVDSIGGELKDGETGSDGSAVWIKVTQ